jgi:hypothetical protein
VGNTKRTINPTEDEKMTEAATLTGPAANKHAEAALQAQKQAKDSKATPARFMLSFGTKYAATCEKIIADAKEDDRDPGEYLVRWLANNYPDPR